MSSEIKLSEELLTRMDTAAPISSPLGNGSSGVEVLAGQENSKASITFIRSDLGTELFSSMRVTASAPLNSSPEDPTSLVGLDGFADAFELEIKLTQFNTFRFSIDEDIDTALKAEDGLYEKIYKRVVDRGDAVDTADAMKVFADGFQDHVVFDYAPDLVDEMYKALGRDPKAADYAGGLSLTVGYEEFTYLDSTSFAESKTDEVPVGFKGFLTRVQPNGKTLLTASLEYQHRSKDAEEKSVPLPINEDGFQEIVSGPLGSPVSDNKLLLSLEMRRFMSDNVPILNRPIGLSLTATYDFENDEFGAKLPILFIRDNKGKLTSGVLFEYNDRNDSLAIGVIVGGSMDWK